MVRYINNVLSRRYLSSTTPSLSPTVMKPASSQKSKAKSSRNSREPSGGRLGLVEAASVAAKRSAKRGRRKVSNNKKSTQTVDTDVGMSNPNPPTDTAPMQMFHGNFVISGGNFTQAESIVNHVNNARPKAFKYLQERVAPAAFHNSAQRIDPPRCHPDTRVAIMQEIYDWITQSEDREQWLLWLNGAAGAGKSALMQSLAERCVQAAIVIATFFFFRGDSSRNTITPLVATLVYQLIRAIPEIEGDIILLIDHDPLIFDQSLETQLQYLIIQPLLRLPPHLKRLLVVFIDGLDECKDRNAQANLIKVLGNISCSGTIPVVFLIASRREPQIEAEFVRKPISNILKTLPLDNSDIEKTSDDIRRYLVDKFRDIKETHRLKQYLPIDWPPASSVKEIVTKSSGQFIFASVAINYVSSPRANPARQLEVIRGIRMRDPSSQNPFVHLDALYQHIFSQIEALDKVLNIIAYVIAGGSSNITHIYEAFLLDPGELDVLFADLTAVILCEPPSFLVDPCELDVLFADPVAVMLQSTLHGLKFLHASLPDFLVDKNRSQQYHIDLDKYRTNLLCRFLERRPPILDPLLSSDDSNAVIKRERSRLSAIENLLEKAEASEQLHSAFMNFNCTFYSETSFGRGWHAIGPNILRPLKQLNFSDQGEAYHHVVDIFAAEYTKHWPSLVFSEKLSVEGESPDLAEQILKQVYGGGIWDKVAEFYFSAS
ncbi:hypothetical protein BJ912DRAFT_25613 [Pholiota molesta]|nr:hypothetical protein BJ912DRAFT_25613 [Pholiota molesta]